jgi:ABC-type enterobactin transport system permease subunit
MWQAVTVGTYILDTSEVVVFTIGTALFLCGVGYGLLVATSRLSEMLTAAGVGTALGQLGNIPLAKDL